MYLKQFWTLEIEEDPSSNLNSDSHVVPDYLNLSINRCVIDINIW